VNNVLFEFLSAEQLRAVAAVMDVQSTVEIARWRCWNILSHGMEVGPGEDVDREPAMRFTENNVSQCPRNVSDWRCRGDDAGFGRKAPASGGQFV